MKRIKEVEHYEEKEIEKLLFGRKVIEVTGNDELILDNGIVLEVIANEGCGGCSSGWYDITELNKVDNAITDIEFVEKDIDGEWGTETSYQIFVYAENYKMKLLQVDGDDGNGYYGSGYHINVKIKED